MNSDQQHLAGLRAEFSPSSPHEDNLISRMAHAQWRMDLYERLEVTAVEMICTGMADMSDPECNLIVDMRRSKTSVMVQIRRLYDKAEQSYNRSHRMLLQGRKPAARVTEKPKPVYPEASGTPTVTAPPSKAEPAGNLALRL